MRATPLEFRLRMIINAAIVVLGFWSPWIRGSSRGSAVLEWLPTQMARAGLLSFSDAFRLVIVCAAACAALGALMRIWGSAYLGPSRVISADMHAGAVTADGPYRYVRNPLYIGLFFMFVGIAMLMPPTGALVALLLAGLFIVRLTLGEEVFLRHQLGEPYRAYLHAVPRFLPRLRSVLPKSGARPHWLLALASELTPIGVFVALACLWFTYNSRLAGQVMLISFGASLLVRALMPSASRSPGAASRSTP